MATITQWTLAQHPDRFVWGPSVAAGRNFRFVAGTQAVSSVVLGGVVWWLIDSPLIGIVIMVFGLAGAAFMLWMSRRQQGWSLVDGRELLARSFTLRDDPEESWQRLATGDPAVYTPMRADQGQHTIGAGLHAFWPADERVTWVVVVRTDGGGASEPIELRDAQHDAMQQALARGLTKPAR